jgi:mannose-6-phosphate isomerase-like protein (cupin superfamily)
MTMPDSSSPSSTPKSSIPADDPTRELSIADPDDPQLRHVAVVGDTYTILLSGEQTAGKYSLIDMNVPHCGGPGPHRHDFEEMFHLLEGEIEFTFRGKKQIVKQGMTINIPANAPHFFTNPEGARARMLCMCAPAGQEEFFMGIGTPVANRTTPAPEQTEEQKKAFLAKAQALAPKYRTELLKP